MEVQDDPAALLNLPAFLGIADDLANSLGFPMGNFEARDMADGPWSFSDQWFNI